MCISPQRTKEIISRTHAKHHIPDIISQTVVLGNADLEKLIAARTMVSDISLISGDLGELDMNSLRTLAEKIGEKKDEKTVGVLGATNRSQNKVFLALNIH